MIQIKPTKPIKPGQSNHTAIGRKTDPNQYALVLIITKPFVTVHKCQKKDIQIKLAFRQKNANCLYHQ